MRDFLLKLRDRPCADCGQRYPPIAMEFDHRDPSTKRYNVAESWCRSFAWIMEEAAKCDIVCRNCHRTRTYLARQRGSSSVRSERIRAGETLAAIAAATPGKSRDGPVAALVADGTAKIDAAVTAGTITADQATRLKAELTEHATRVVDSTRPAGTKGGRGRP